MHAAYIVNISDLQEREKSVLASVYLSLVTTSYLLFTTRVYPRCPFYPDGEVRVVPLGPNDIRAFLECHKQEFAR